MTITQLQATAGPRDLADGESGAVRASRSGSGLLIASVAARYQEAVLRGNVYGTCNVAGITTQAGLSATTPALTLFNPSTSGKNLVLWYAGCTFSVIFAAVATVFLAANDDTSAAAVTGTADTIRKNMLLGGRDTPAATPMLAATLPAAPGAIAILGMGGTGDPNLLPFSQAIGRWFDGGIIMKPNTALSIQTAAASGAAGTWCEFIWEEIDI